jgi:hypothetical protein
MVKRIIATVAFVFASVCMFAQYQHLRTGQKWFFSHAARVLNCILVLAIARCGLVTIVYISTDCITMVLSISTP